MYCHVFVVPNSAADAFEFWLLSLCLTKERTRSVFTQLSYCLASNLYSLFECHEYWMYFPVLFFHVNAACLDSCYAYLWTVPPKNSLGRHAKAGIYPIHKSCFGPTQKRESLSSQVCFKGNCILAEVITLCKYALNITQIYYWCFLKRYLSFIRTWSILYFLKTQ